MLYIGLDVGGMSVKAGVVDESGNILIKSSCPTGVERGHEATIRDMAALSKRIVAECGHSMDEIASVGVGIPGVENPSTGLVPFCNNLHWHDVPLSGMLSDFLGKPVFVDNDATVAGLAESVAGVSRGYDSSVFITLGTGVGGGIVLNRRAFTGAHGVGSEIGHMVVVAGGEPCNCGHRGCWEKYASATAIIRMGGELLAKKPGCALSAAAHGDPARVTAKLVLDLAKAGDEDCMGVFREYVYYLCVGLASLVNILDPEVFVLGGGVSHAGEFLLDAVREELPKHIFYTSMPFAGVELATLGNDAGIIGAAMLGRAHEAGI
ncbi:MAG: ROK family protein [Clostridiales bacterium]|nr:ROK family protein [Clostridiales bacterium]